MVFCFYFLNVIGKYYYFFPPRVRLGTVKAFWVGLFISTSSSFWVGVPANVAILLPENLSVII